VKISGQQEIALYDAILRNNAKLKYCTINKILSLALTICIHSICFYPVPMSCCAYSCTQYGLRTQYMLLTNVNVLLCLQLHTVRSAYTVNASNQCRCLALPKAAHSTVSVHITCFKPMPMSCCTYSCTQYSLCSACFKPMPMSCCAYSCTQYGLHKQYILLPNADILLCL